MKKKVFMILIAVACICGLPLNVFSLTTYGDVAPLGNRDGVVNVGDALVTLRFALTLETYTQEDMEHADIAPLDSYNQPDPDGQITVGDALVVLRIALGLVELGADSQYKIADYFPLDGSWETDQWTMFTSQREIDINGINTAGMVDTLYPGLYYWTNDKNGWRMHGFMDFAENYVSSFSEPIVFAAPLCKIGVKSDGVIHIEDEGAEDLKYEVTLVGLEDVSVPAGDFASCLKFEIVIYPYHDTPDNYGSETVWLGKDAGFVKGKTDKDAYQYIFTRNGTIRRLLSYHVHKSSELTEDQRAIKDTYHKAECFIAEKNIDGLMDLYSSSYVSECMDKEGLRSMWENVFDEHIDALFFMSPGEIVIHEKKAEVTVEFLATGMSKEGEQRWWNWERYAAFFIKENDVWKNYGDQLDFIPSGANVFLRSVPDGEYFVIDLDFRDCNGEYISLPEKIAFFTIDGPPETIISADGITNGTNGFYIFTLEDVNGKIWQFTDYLDLDLPQPLSIPEHISPDDGAVDIPPGEVSLSWNPVDNSDYYWVDFSNISEARQESSTEVIATCPADTSFAWSILARHWDIYGLWNGDYDYESVSDWWSFATAAQ